MSGMQKFLDRQRDMAGTAERKSPAAAPSAPAAPAPTSVRKPDATAKRAEALLGAATSIGEIDIDLIDPNPNQPRLQFDEAYIEALKTSIAEFGLQEEITLRPGKGERFILVAGECRVRAHRALSRTRIAAKLAREMNEEKAALFSLIENLCRENLSDFEEFHGFQTLLQKGFASSQTDLANKVGMRRDKLVKLMAFGRLPPAAADKLRTKPSSMGYTTAAALASFHTQGHGKLVEELVARLVDGDIPSEAKMLASMKRRLRVHKKAPDDQATSFAGPGGKTVFRLLATPTQLRINFQKTLPAASLRDLSKAVSELLKQVAARQKTA